MRTIVLLLLLANITLFGYTRLDTVGTGEAARLAQQVNPDRIKLLTPQQVATLGPAKIAALADVCIEWGTFGDADRARALAEIEPLGLGRLLTQKKVDTTLAYWVYLPKFANKTAADKRVAELNAAGLKDVAVVDSGPQRFAISLGAFRAEDTANAYVQALDKEGRRERQGHVASAGARADAARHSRSGSCRGREGQGAATRLSGNGDQDWSLRKNQLRTAPTLAAVAAALPPGGVQFAPWDGPAARMTARRMAATRLPSAAPLHPMTSHSPARCSSNMRSGLRSTSAFRASPGSSPRCPVPMSRRWAGCCSRERRARRSDASPCGR